MHLGFAEIDNREKNDVKNLTYGILWYIIVRAIEVSHHTPHTQLAKKEFRRNPRSPHSSTFFFFYLFDSTILGLTAVPFRGQASLQPSLDVCPQSGTKITAVLKKS